MPAPAALDRIGRVIAKPCFAYARRLSTRRIAQCGHALCNMGRVRGLAFDAEIRRGSGWHGLGQRGCQSGLGQGVASLA